MTCKIKNAVVLCFAMAGLLILSCCMFCENVSPFLLPLGMLCVTTGNMVHGIFMYKKNKKQ